MAKSCGATAAARRVASPPHGRRSPRMTKNPPERTTGLLELIADLQDLDRYREHAWEGSFSDYLDLVRAKPFVARNAYQRLWAAPLTSTHSPRLSHT